MSAAPVLNRSDPSLWPAVLDPFHGRCIRRRSRVGQALATEAIAESIRSGGVWEAESNKKLFDLVSTPAATNWDMSFTVERINFYGFGWEARRDEPGRKGTLQHARLNTVGNGDCNFTIKSPHFFA
jgi:hypothetical protein